MQGLQPKYKTVDPAVRKLETENQRLKNIIAKQALQIEFKDELLEKISEPLGHQKFHRVPQHPAAGSDGWLAV